MSLDHAAPGVRTAPGRHRRPWHLPELADRLCRRALTVAAGLFAACGPAHALGLTDLVFWTVLVGLGLAAAAVPLGLFGLRHGDTAD
ncbi:hypothetical protein ACWT_4667 [Actinoplanes sp. SE50]|uniref:hypothetical protein n=1 Tax=unclassified Actinoplanes TaxID=2626549 RepID=UPI00023EBBD4|nr:MULTISPECIES: hypothetical protein [unclassified Actinoplanes]AEV85689.1 hypothetical protein ACPL_4798 [Actinoplanes sp. SE50/110]ATO84082.1 hypothetical protein ACWT_4667 [Actinoplanes sp. SE50]SLM01492.1 hypothetical protein ACSP50_4728 [Actinoplanes sp. SE50/110]